MLQKMQRQKTRRQNSGASIPRWGWAIILCFLALIGGTILHLKGTVPTLLSKLQRVNPPATTPGTLPEVAQESSPINPTLVRAYSLTIITRSKFLLDRAEIGFISSSAEDYYMGCIKASEEIKTNIKKIPVDDPKISEARSHLVEMAIGFERMIMCFEESDLNGKRYFRLPSDNKLAFNVSAKSVIDHYKRLELVCPE